MPLHSLNSITRLYSALAALGYAFCSCADYVDGFRADRLIITRVDIDSWPNTPELAACLQSMSVRATFNVRTRGDYNPYSLTILPQLRQIATYHEIGYHHEAVDASLVGGGDPGDIVGRDRVTLAAAVGVYIRGAASHRNVPGYGTDNLALFASGPESLGLAYEAYDHSPRFGLFWTARYISDSWGRWNAYDGGLLRPDDHRTPAEHAAQDHPPLIYLLLHPDHLT